ncbi:MAG: M55 family metallopeptidase [Clostridia bacterium]|nr:M55 family metallopeptidase [Clostridia bacterium]MBQ8513372.1 M55 family metallopeptidase [Clostridia bacterium]
MYKRILLLCDLEGVNNVVGVPYEGLLKGTEQWETARRQAALELNAAADALYEAGAETVALWDNHGGGKNIDPADLDSRITLIEPKGLRLSFAKDAFDCVCFFGYHAMEGTLGGVLAHTMSSKTVQFYKLNGKYIGEVDMDAAICASHGIASCFYAGGDIACAQAQRAVDGIVTVVTKTELERNRAIFRDNAELLAEIREKIVEAVNRTVPIRTLSFPCTMEKSFKRVEDAAAYLARLRSLGIDAAYPDDDILGRDAHTVSAVVTDTDTFIRCI